VTKAKSHAKLFADLQNVEVVTIEGRELILNRDDSTLFGAAKQIDGPA